MQRIPLIDPALASGNQRSLFERANGMFGSVPNNVRTAANSPRALDALLGFFAATGDLTIGARLSNQVLLSISETNACDYCTAILTTTFAPAAGLSSADILGSRKGMSTDPREAAALQFAKAVLESRGRVADVDIEAVRSAGFGDEQITELVAVVALGCFTNFLNNVADTTLDFQKAEPVEAGSVACGCK